MPAAQLDIEEAIALDFKPPCPCCGRQFEGTDPRRIIPFIRLSAVQRTIADALARNLGRDVSTEWLVGVVYGSGGGLNARRTLTSHCYNLRQKLKPYRLAIVRSQVGTTRMEWEAVDKSKIGNG